MNLYGDKDEFRQFIKEFTRNKIKLVEFFHRISKIFRLIFVDIYPCLKMRKKNPIGRFSI